MRATCLLGLAVSIGCGGNGKPSIATSKNNFCDQFAAVACYDLYQCCAEGEIEHFLGVGEPRTSDQCRDDVRRTCQRRYANVESSLSANRVRLDTAILNACLTSLVAPDNSCATSAPTFPWTTPCSQTAFAGNVSNGSACFHGYECAVDSYCAPNNTCTALPTDGMTCATGGICASSAFCSGATCRARGGAGSPCSFGSSQCLPGFFCDLSSGTGQCAAQHNTGDKCSGYQSGPQACKSGSCAQGYCANTGFACFGDADCSGHCPNNAGAFCSNDTNCGVPGHCSVTTSKNCYGSADCMAGDGTCIFPNQCVHDACLAGGVCVDAQYPVDYCTGAPLALPLPPG